MHAIFPTQREDTPLSSTTRGLQRLTPDRVRAPERANTLQPRRKGGGALKDVYSASGRRYRRRRLAPPLCFPSPPAEPQLLRCDPGRPPPPDRMSGPSYTEITERFSGAASIAALRHLPHIAVSPRPRELHTSHMEECTYMNINMQTTPPPTPSNLPLSHMQGAPLQRRKA